MSVSSSRLGRCERTGPACCRRRSCPVAARFRAARRDADQIQAGHGESGANPTITGSALAATDRRLKEIRRGPSVRGRFER